MLFAAVLSNAESVLNHSEARIDGYRNTYALPRAALNSMIVVILDSHIDAREIWTKFVKHLKRKPLRGYDRGHFQAI